MKVSVLFSTLFAVVPIAFGQFTPFTAQVTFDTVYDDGSESLDVVSCSTGVNGLANGKCFIPVTCTVINNPDKSSPISARSPPSPILEEQPPLLVRMLKCAVQPVK